MKLFLLLGLCTLVVNSAFADYYIKFTASGDTASFTTPMVSQTNAWLEVSIVDSHPLDGPIHYKGSETGSFTGVVTNKVLGVDNVHFYFAEVPRSITIIDKSTGGKTKIVSGAPPIKFENAPSFLLPDSLLVAPGISTVTTGVFKFYVAAAMPLKIVPGTHTISRSIFPNGWNNTTYERCPQGWSQSIIDAHGVEMWQSSKRTNHSYCDARAMYSGTLSHIIREQ